MRNLFLGVLLGVVALSACADDDGTSDLLDPGPPPGGQQLTTPEYTLQPGEEKYFCYSFQAPIGEHAIVHVDPIDGQLVHHKLLVQTITPGDEFYECPELFNLAWSPIWAAGAGANSLDLPDGVAFELPGSASLMVQYHLQNVQDHAITERSGINLTYADDPSTLQPAGIFAMGSFDLTIPNGATDYTQSRECTAPQDMNVFAVFPHMHKLGTKLDLVQGTSSADASEMYGIDPWKFGDQPFAPVDQTLAEGDYLRSTCHWRNMTGHDVGFGESSDDEMCFTVLFYYPATGGPLGCVQ